MSVFKKCTNSKKGKYFFAVKSGKIGKAVKPALPDLMFDKRRKKAQDSES